MAQIESVVLLQGDKLGYWDALNIFLEQVSRFEIPRNPMSRVKLLAKEIAQGALQEVWGTTDFEPTDVYRKYREQRWSNNTPALTVLIQIGYLSHPVGGQMKIEKSAFDLVEQAAPVDVFVSYKRDQSSALALLVLARLKAIGLNPFLDMSLEVGGKWRAELQQRIAECEYFVLLLGEKTLESPNVKDEIEWAKDKIIIPIWHSGFDLAANESKLTEDAKRILQDTNAIVISGESALVYNNAIVELLNRFGVTP